MENQNDNTEMIKNLTNILEGLDNSQEQLEKNAFDVINSSDTSLNLVKESIGSVEDKISDCTFATIIFRYIITYFFNLIYCVSRTSCYPTFFHSFKII